MARALPLVVGLGLLCACEAVADLTVHYVDAAVGTDDSAGGDSAADAAADTKAQTDAAPPQPLGPCPCDTPAAIGCCIPNGGATPFCLAYGDAPACVDTGGMFIECTHADMVDSACCWRGGIGGGAQTAYAATCNGNAVACASSTDCPGGGACAASTCGVGAGAYRVGVCGTTAPSCP